MRFTPDSVSGQRLMAHEVPEEIIASTNWFVWDLQLGKALTLPIPVLGTCVFIKKASFVRDEEGNLRDDGSISLPVHELCHAQQIADWGALTYMRRQLMARVRTMNVFAKETPEEKPCYDAQDKVGERLANR